MLGKNNYIEWQHEIFSLTRREVLNGHKSLYLWLIGLSDSGKATSAHAMEERMSKLGFRTFLFYGHNVRYDACSVLNSKKPLAKLSILIHMNLET